MSAGESPKPPEDWRDWTEWLPAHATCDHYAALRRAGLSDDAADLVASWAEQDYDAMQAELAALRERVTGGAT